jgi:exopolysaccharide production protein ExoQ
LATAALQQHKLAAQLAKPRAITGLLVAWALLMPLVFFAVHGNFSFEQGASIAGENSLVGLIPARNLGTLGYIVIPGIAYSVIVTLIVANVRAVLSLSVSKMKTLTFLALLTICSAAWSQNPMRSTYNGMFYLLGTLFAYYMVLRFEPEQLMDIVTMAGVLICSLGLVMVLFFPQFGIAHEGRYAYVWKGIFMDRTSAAKCLVFLLSPAIVFGYRRLNLLRMVYILMVISLIVMAHSATAVVVLSVYIAFMAMLYVSHRLEWRTTLVLAGFLCVAVVLLALLVIPFASDIAALLGRDLTLTGRTEIWSAVLQSIGKRPLLGYGYYAYWLGLTGESANAILRTHWVFGYAHNGMLEILLQLGFVGLAVFLMTLTAAMKNAWLCLRHGGSIGLDWYIGLIVLTILYNVDEATVVWPNELLSILYVVACCGLAMMASQLKERKRLSACLPDVHDLSLA